MNTYSMTLCVLFSFLLITASHTKYDLGQRSNLALGSGKGALFPGCPGETEKAQTLLICV